MNYWLVVGARKNWDTAFKYGNIWGLRQTQQHLWESLNENDKVLFYATNPVKGIIGYGIVRTKIRQNRPLWPEEVRKNKVIWPLRFEFDVESCLPQNEWETKKLVSKTIWPRAGFQPLSETIGEALVSAIGTTEYVVPTYEPSFVAEEPAEFVTGYEKQGKVPPSHKELQRKLVEIGELQGYLAEPEYVFDIGKLDVVWRRVLNSVPTYVFEVQVSGDIYHALAKLKHAFDLWNSHIFIVASETDHNKAESLLSGTFHEIGNRIKFIELEKVEELYERKKAYFDFERELGIVI
jgi:predicted RNA-binding protein